MLETLALMGHGFVNAMSLSNLLFMAGGTAIGIIIGCLPGLSAAMGVALLLPMTFTMAPETGLIVLGAIYCGAIFGGSISAILIHTPGTPASATSSPCRGRRARHWPWPASHPSAAACSPASLCTFSLRCWRSWP